jgi:hypothetical protein
VLTHLPLLQTASAAILAQRAKLEREKDLELRISEGAAKLQQVRSAFSMLLVVSACTAS